VLYIILHTTEEEEEEVEEEGVFRVTGYHHWIISPLHQVSSKGASTIALSFIPNLK
jgi:hypothetical protein